MTRVAVTGAAGSVGRETLAALEPLDEFEVIAITHREMDVTDVSLDVTDEQALVAALADADVVLHLAGVADTDADWDRLHHANVDGVKTLYDAAVATDVERVIFASSNHVAHARNVEQPGKTATLRQDPAMIDDEAPPGPDSLYAVSKIAGEAFGSYHAERHDLTVVNLRIGWLLTPEELRATQTGSDAQARYARAMWLSPRDWRQLVRQAITIEIDTGENPLTVNAVSGNAERTLSIRKASWELGYSPSDDASEIVGRGSNAPAPSE